MHVEEETKVSVLLLAVMYIISLYAVFQYP